MKHCYKTLFSKAFICSVISLPTCWAFGQTLTIDSNALNTAISGSVRDTLWKDLNTGPDGNLLGNDSAVVMQVYDQNQKVNFNYALSTWVRPSRKTGEPHIAWSYKLNAGAPVNPDDKDNPLPTLDALKNAWSVGFSLNYSRIPSVSIEEIEAFKESSSQWKAASAALVPLYLDPDAELPEGCEDRLSGLVSFGLTDFLDLDVTFELPGTRSLALTNWKDVNLLSDLKSQREALIYVMNYLEKIPAPDAQQRGQLEALRKLDEYVSFDSAVTMTCMPEYFNEYIAEHVDQTWKTDHLTQTYAFEAKTGLEEFDVFNPLNFDPRTENEHVHSATLSSSWHRSSTGGSQTFTASYTHQRAFDAAKEETMCILDPATSRQTCKTGAFAAPMQSDNQLLSFDFRTRISNVLGGKPVAVQVKFTRDFEKHLSGLDIPVHLFSIAGEELNAGIRLGWESETDETKIGVFYGQKF